MTKEELEVLRLKLQLQVHLELIRALYSALAGTSPALAQRFREGFQTARKERQQLALDGLQPGYSDLVAAEYQEALEDALSFIEEVVSA